MEPADDLAIQGHRVTTSPDNVFALAPHWTKWSARGCCGARPLVRASPNRPSI